MNTPAEREAVLARLSDAFSRGDNAAIIEAMRPDVDVEVPGTSEFAGHHHGPDEVDRWLRGVRRAFRTMGDPIVSHEGDDMVVSRVVRLKLGNGRSASGSRSTSRGASGDSSGKRTTSRRSMCWSKPCSKRPTAQATDAAARPV
jgi:hypothetical protein